MMPWEEIGNELREFVNELESLEGSLCIIPTEEIERLEITMSRGRTTISWASRGEHGTVEMSGTRSLEQCIKSLPGDVIERLRDTDTCFTTLEYSVVEAPRHGSAYSLITVSRYPRKSAKYGFLEALERLNVPIADQN